MIITVFSFVTSLLLFNIYIFLIAVIRPRNIFLFRFGIIPVVLLITACIFRLILFVELPFSKVLTSEVIYPAIVDFFTAEIIGIHVYELLIAVWIIGSIYNLQKYIRQLIFLNKLSSSLMETQDKRIISCMDEIMAESGKTARVKIIQCNEIAVPMIAGFFKPVIFLPYTDFSDIGLKNILTHEWTHFLHKDAWTKLFVSAISIVFWWNPFMPVLKNELNQTIELRCDLRVISHMEQEDRLIYLESIIKIIKYANNNNLHKLRSSAVSTPFVAVKRDENILQRFSVVSNYDTCKRRNIFSSAVVCTLIVLSFVASYGVVLQPLYAPTVEKTDEESFSITPESSYLVDNGDGTYSLYIDNNFIATVDNKNVELLSSLPIK